MSDADIDTLIARLGEILEGQAALAARLTEALERMSAIVTRHEDRFRRCRCMNCKAYEPATYAPFDAAEETGPAQLR
jgi:hypothetical protein